MAYMPLTPGDDATLHWRQPAAMQWQWVLAADRGEFARLTMSSWSSAATVETARASWTLEHRGFWNPAIVARDGEREVATLEIRNAWMRDCADLRTPEGGLVATWQMQSFLRGLTTWTDAAGQPLITFRGGTDGGGVASWLRTQCRVDLTPEGFAHPQRDLLLCLGWHINVLASGGMA